MPDRTPRHGPPAPAATTARGACARCSWTTRRPALSELSYLLRRDDRIGQIRTASSGADALRALDAAPVDVVLLRHQDAGPGRHGPGPGARPVRPTPAGRVRHRVRRARRGRVRGARDRLRDEAGARRAARRGRTPGARRPHGRRRPRRPGPEATEDETIPVELGGVTTFLQRSQVLYAQAHGDYARLHTGDKLPPRPRSRSPRSRSAGPQPASCASTAAPWSPCRTSARSAWSTGGAPCSSARPSSR